MSRSAQCPHPRPAYSLGGRFAFVAVLFCACLAQAETYRLPLFVGTTDSGQTGVLRIQNASSSSGTVAIYAVNDAGSKSGPATLTLAANAAVEIDADDLVSGNSANGVSGGVGTITGGVRLEIVTALSINALAYLRTSDDTFAVLHDEIQARMTASGGYEYRVRVFNPASNLSQASSLRLINPNGRSASVTITGRDDSGAEAASGSLRLTLAAGAARRVSAQDLEAGGSGLGGQLGAGSGKWRLLVSADQPIEVVNLVKSSTGRLDNLSSAARDGLAPHDALVFDERFVGRVISTRSEHQTGSLSIRTGKAFSETIEPVGGSSSTQSGNYVYTRANRDAGELRLNYSQGDPCITNLQFSSRSDGWYASRCGGSDDAQATWRGGRWTVVEDATPPAPGDESGPRFAADGRSFDQNFDLNQAISTLILPAASGGTGALTYSLTPAVPGLGFDAARRQLTGTPTESGVRSMIYTATDSDGESGTLNFLIVVRDANSEDCLLGLLVRARQSCNYPGTTDAFSVKADGSASFLVVTSSRAINLPNRTYQGKVYDFRAEHKGDGVWRIERLQGVQAPTPNTTPKIPAADAPSDQTYTQNETITRLTLPAATDGEGALVYSLTPTVPGIAFNAATRRLSGTPTTAGTYAMTYRVTDEDGDSSSVAFTITVEEADIIDEGTPDLVLSSPTVNDNTLKTGEPFTFLVTLRNEGDGESAATTLRYYESSDATISSSDKQVRTEQVSALAASGARNESESLLTPLTPGTYYYGACIDSVAGERNTGNNCSGGARVTVTPVDTTVDGRDLIVEKPGVSDRSPTTGASFTLNATVRNRGDESTPATTVRYYRSTDATITTSDTAEGTDSVPTLASQGTSYESIRINAPSSTGIYYYGACVETVNNEVNRNNNCSTAVRVAVSSSNSGGGNNPGDGGGSIPTKSPDLTVDSVRVSTSSGGYAFSFDLTIKVRNRGSASAQQSLVTYYLSNDSRITTSDENINTPQSVDVLAASASSSFTLSLNAPTNTGTYYYGACVSSVVNELNVNNNCSSSASIRVQVDGPDLRVDSPSVSNSNPGAGKTFTLRARVRNGGNESAEATTLTYYRSSDSTIDGSDTPVGTADDISALSAGQSRSESTSVTAENDIGVYYYGACVGSVSGDTNSANNCSSGVRVKIPGADLVVLSPRADDTTPEPGDRFSLSVKVRNSGVAESASTNLVYLRSDDATINLVGDITEGNDSVASLKSGRSDDESINITAQTTPGTYYYGACVEAVSNEDDRTNNCSAAVKVTVKAPDLVVQSPSVDDSTPEAGDKFTLQVIVGNSGGAEAPSTTLTYYQSDDKTITTDDTSLNLTDSVSSLNAGRTRRESASVTAPTTPGEYYFGACVDAVANESDTANNCSPGIKVTVPAPDLVVDSVRVDDTTPLAGERFELTVRVRNRGGGGATATTLTYLRSTDNVISVDDDQSEGTDSVGKLSASESDQESIRITAPATPGVYYYGACVAAVTGESKTDNNCSKAVKVTVPAPDLTVDSPRVDDSTITQGDEVEISVRVRNRGGGVAAATTLKYYESDDSTIGESDDTEIGTDSIKSLDPSKSTNESFDYTPSQTGTYYYGACVDADSNESKTDNNCSAGVRVRVSSGS